MQQTQKTTAVTFHTITEHDARQRIDNFLLRLLKGIPKTHIYRIIRKGEVRINKKRTKPEQKLQPGDIVRIPPVRMEEKKPLSKAPDHLLRLIKEAMLFEDEELIVLNKPGGLAVHGGSHAELGIIEILRQLRCDLDYLELVHRLDRETSGLLLVAKSRTMLQALHALLREAHQIEKHYTALVSGEWKGGTRKMTHTLKRTQQRTQKVQVSDTGKASTSIFTPLRHYKGATLMDVQILTGRMHQIRTQLAYLGHPIIGDARYGDERQNRYFATHHHSARLFLHATLVSFQIGDTSYSFEAPLCEALQKVLQRLV